MGCEMKPMMRALICAFALSALAFGAQAATDAEKTSKAQYEAAIARADADYKVATEACSGKQGNDKDVCIQQAKSNRDKAKADAKALHKSQDAAADAQEDKLAADYKVAKERCDSLSGDAKDACIKNAKLKYHQ